MRYFEFVPARADFREGARRFKFVYSFPIQIKSEQRKGFGLVNLLACEPFPAGDFGGVGDIAGES